MSLDVHFFTTEQEAGDFLEGYLQRNKEVMLQLQQQKKNFSPAELNCPIMLIAEREAYSFCGGVYDALEIIGVNYKTPAALAKGMREALVEYVNILPEVILKPQFFTIEEMSSTTFEQIVQAVQEELDVLSDKERDHYYAQIGDKENLAREIEKYLFSRGLTKSEVEEFKLEYQKVPKGLN